MRHPVALGVVSLFVLLGWVQCVGDSSTVMDGGPDATQNDVSPPDGAMDGGSSDGDAGSTPPTPDGSVVWVNHYNNNVYPIGGQAFTDIVVNDNGGLTYLVAGQFLTDPSAGNHFNFGTIPLGPSNGLDPVAGGLGTSGSAVWAKSPTTAGSPGANADVYEALATDSSGNVYVFGYTSGTSITLKDTLTGPTSFVAKLTATGTPLWDHVYSSAGNPIYGPVAITLAGSSLVIAVTFTGSITYDTSMTLNSQGSGDSDAFVTALDVSNGTTQWAGAFGSPNNDSINTIAATPAGDVVVAGTLNGTMQGLQGAGMPVGQLGDAGTGTDVYVLKIDSTGKATYNLVYGDPASGAYVGGIAYQNGTIAVAGSFSGNVNFGKGTFASTGADGMVFTVNETTKATTFAVQLAGAATDGFTSVALDPWGEVVAAGRYGNSNASAQLGPQPLQQTSLGTAGMVLAKWSPTGTLLWAHGYVPTLDGGAPPYLTPDASDVPQTIVPVRVQTTSTGLIVVTGTMVGGTDFGTGYEGQVSTYAWGHCTCFTCNATCLIVNPPACCNTVIPGWSADGIVGVWQP